MRWMMILAVGATAFATSAAAAPAPTPLSQCLVENASPKDQAALMRWMFSALSLNPSLGGITSLTQQDRDGINKALAATFQRLLTQDCRTETVSMLKAKGPKGLEEAFESLGARAAQQLMSDPAAQSELEKFTKFLDEERFQDLMKEGGFSPAGQPLK